MTQISGLNPAALAVYTKKQADPQSTPEAPAQRKADALATPLAQSLALQFGAAKKRPSNVLPPKDPAMIETLHGQQVADPFRPLEDLDAPETVQWWKAQNKRTNAFLSSAQAVRNKAIQWHQEIRDYTRESMQSEYGGNYFFTRQAGLEPQPTYWVRLGAKDATPKVLIDPTTLSADGTVALGSMDVSPNGKLVAYTVSEAGSDWQTMRFRNVETGEDVNEELTGLRFTSANWDPDGKGVIYCKPLPAEEADGQHFGVYHHTLGQAQSQDVQIFKRPDVENSFVGGFRLEKDDPFLFMSVSSGTNSENGLYVQRPGSTEFQEILAPKVAAISPFYRDGDTLYATTDLNASRSRLVAIDMNNPAPENWTTLVPESDDPGNKMQYGFVADGKLFVGWSKGGADTIDVRTLNGQYIADIPIPLGSTVGFGQVRPSDKNFEISIGGYLSPGTRYRYTVANNELTFIKKSDIPRDLTEIADVERLYATSKDGTQVPMWVIRPKDMPKDGSSATVLYGYGGFNVPLEPGFSYNIAHWVEQGGVYVVANLRGGGEFGKAWYDAGRLENKQNVFDDFAACAEALIAQGYTQPKRLAIMGGSNGGLLTAVTSQQRPDLFGAVVSQVPVTDMLRFHTNNYGAAWMSDYGNPEKPEDFAVSMQYSPLHNVQPASEGLYPPTLIMTGDHDDRVAPWHAFKWAATRHEQGHTDNTLLRVEERAGHGAGKPTQKVIEESADTVAFLTQTLGPLRPN
jgi:prolyl oligopeptidase